MIVLQRIGPGFACSNANSLSQIRNEYLSITYVARFGSVLYRINGAVNDVFIDGDLQLDFGQKIDDIFGTAIDFSVSFWRPKPRASVTVMPWMPMSPSAARTSSSLWGWMTAVMSFILNSSLR